MIRVVNLCLLMITIVTAFALYRVKYDVGSEMRHVAQLRQQIGAEHDALALLQAEWSHLNEPGRVQALAQRHLDLEPARAVQIVTFRDLPPRPLEEEPLVAGGAPIVGGPTATASIR